MTVPSEVTKSLETSRKPVVVNIKGENGNPALADETEKKAPMVETIVVNLPSKIKAEDEEKAQVKIKGPSKNHIKASVQHGTTVLEIPEGKSKHSKLILGGLMAGKTTVCNHVIRWKSSLVSMVTVTLTVAQP